MAVPKKKKSLALKNNKKWLYKKIILTKLLFNCKYDAKTTLNKKTTAGLFSL